MKFKTILFFIALIAVCNISCNNDLKILAPYKNITVVYGLMDQNDSVHYFRINKAFEGSGNAYEMAKQYDSIYYPVGLISAVLEDSSTTTNSIVATYKLDTTTAIPLGPGTFPYPKQLLYYSKAQLNPNDYFNLIITNTKTGQKITGSTSLLSDVNLGSFVNGTMINISNNSAVPTTLSWNSVFNGRIYQMTIRFFYSETYQSNRTSHFLDWIFPSQTSSTLAGQESLIYTFTAIDLYDLIASSMKPELGVTRTADSVQVIFTTGSDDLNTYVQLSQPPTGINQDVPSFSDIKNAVGLYTSRHVQTFYHKQLGQADLDSIKNGSITGNLGFQ